MPTYEYECMKCHHRFEEFQKITDKPLTKCPVCGKKLRRLISGGAGLIFKGKGFYVTDYKNTNISAVSEPKKGVTSKSKDSKKDSVTDKPAGSGQKDKVQSDITKKPDN